MNDSMNAYTVDGNNIFLFVNKSLTQTGFYSSNNNGETWSEINIPNAQGATFRSFSATGSSFIIVDDNFPEETYISNDFGSSWHEIGTPNNFILNAYTNGKYYFDISTDGNYISADEGQNWFILSDLANFRQPRMLFANNSALALSNQGASYSANNGFMGSWVSLNSEIPNLPYNGNFISAQNYVIYTGQDIQAMYQNFIYYDTGASWVKISYPPNEMKLITSISIYK